MSIDQGFVPSVCYSECNSAFALAQTLGKSDELCDPASTFSQEYDSCLNCVKSNGGSEGVTDVDYLNNQFAQFIAACVGVNSTSPTTEIQSSTSTPAIPASYLTVHGTFVATVLSALQLDGGVPVLTTVYNSINVSSPLPAYFTHLSIDSLISSFIPLEVLSELAVSVSLAAAAASITGDPTSLIYSALEDASPPGWFVSAIPATYTAQMNSLESSINVLRAENSTATTSSATTGAAPSSSRATTSTTTSSPVSQNQASSKAWIAGAVIGPVAGLALLLSSMFLLLRRRRRRLALKTKPARPDSEMIKYERAQLHGDSLPAPPQVRMYEMDGEQYSRELPVVERPQEVPAGQFPAELHGSGAGDGITRG